MARAERSKVTQPDCSFLRGGRTQHGSVLFPAVQRGTRWHWQCSCNLYIMLGTVVWETPPIDGGAAVDESVVTQTPEAWWGGLDTYTS